jgi:ERCC4-type nuclease
VRDELLRHFRSLEGMLAASKSELEEVEGIGAARAAMLRRHFDRWRTTAATWEPDPA